MRRRKSPPAEYAVVAGVDLNGLGVVRALAGAGVPLVILDTDLAKPSASTRYGVKLRVRSLSGGAFIADLLALRPRFESNPVLFLTHEASVGSVSAERARLAAAYRFNLPSHSLMEALLDKVKFQALAERHGFPIPRAIRLTGPEDEDAIRQLRFPCVLKPARKHPQYDERFAKAYKVANAEEVVRLWPAMRQVIDQATLQEWIEGGDSDVYFCLQYRALAGQSVASFVGRKVCQWPPLVGGTASCMPAPEASAELKTLTDGFFAAVGFVGIGSMEYKRDSRDGRFYMVEPTVGRTDFQEEISALNGVNIPLAAYRSELGLAALPDIAVNPPRAWRDPFGYARAREAGAPDPMPALSSRIKTCDAYFRANDPMPYMTLKLQAVRNRLSRIVRALTSAPIRS